MRATGATAWIGALGVVSVALVSGRAGGVEQGPLGTTPAQGAGLTKVEPGHADLNPLRLSIREMAADLRAPVGFDAVYRLPGDAGAAGTAPIGRARFARVSGALAAVFPQSEYVSAGRRGTVAAIPAGTVFYIGRLPGNEAGAGGGVKERAAGITAVSTAARTEASTAAAGAVGAARPTVSEAPGAPAAASAERAGAAGPAGPSVCGGEGYRGERVRALLRRAAGAIGDAGEKPEPVEAKAADDEPAGVGGAGSSE